MGTFRENLRSELLYQDVTIKELSARTNIPVASLDCYLGARETMPAADAAVKIARTLGVSVEYLVAGNAPESRIPPNREAQTLIRQLGKLNAAQCRAILALIRAFTP